MCAVHHELFKTINMAHQVDPDLIGYLQSILTDSYSYPLTVMCKTNE